jgi:hypothetical protein
VPALDIKLPLLVQLPFTVSVFEPDTVSVAPVLIVRFLQTSCGAYCRLISTWSITLLAADGITPLHQLAALFQLYGKFPTKSLLCMN